MAVATDQVIVLRITEQNVVADHTVYKVIAGLAMDDITGTNIISRVSRIKVMTAAGVIK